MSSPLTPDRRRRFLAPEVVQSSAMDCGPAALKCLLEGFGIRASYGRLREACQTDVDGTSIDTLEDAAVQLGLDAQQIMLPVDHLFRPEMKALPAIVVVRLPGGVTHFVVVWRRYGPFVQVMDPATGRRWTSVRRFLEEVYVHSMPVPAADWRAWAGSAPALDALGHRLSELGIRKHSEIVANAEGDPTWQKLAALDASVRLLESMATGRAVRRGRPCGRVLQRLLNEPGAIPPEYWTVRAAPADAQEPDWVNLRGAVLVHVSGRRR